MFSRYGVEGDRGQQIGQRAEFLFLAHYAAH